ncbi:MAG: T9SS type A sorting domain-containing protein [Chitinophagaceae bacterium]|nr:T9SS type A sorting domain-containing protein [Chitinophagaceae bacterium]
MRKIYLLVLTLFSGTMVSAQNALLIPPVLNGPVYNLNLQTGTVNFYAGTPTQTMGVNGAILGPTLIMQKGDSITMNVNNQIGDTTTMHWHGLHVAPHNDGGPHTVILPGTTWSPSFTVRDHASTYWYHPHLHHKTNMHVSKGIAGFIIVRDNEEAGLSLPRTYGVDDIPLAIQTKDFDTNNQIVVPSNNDDAVMVNATINPFVQVPAQVVRLRLLNGSAQRVFNIGLTNNMNFHVIGTDGGLLNNPLSLTRLTLAPGERAEILIDLSNLQGQTINLMSYAAEFPNGYYGATYPGMGQGLVMNGYNPNPLNGANFNLLALQVGAPIPGGITTIPTTLVNDTPIPAAQSNTTRALTFMPAQMGPNQLNGDFMINNAMFDMNVINYTIPLNNTEIWTLTNNSGISHPFHLHDVPFYILDRNGQAPAAVEQGRKDVVLVRPQEVVRFITQFTTFSDPMVPFMYHCHMLTHEDGGMMGQFIVSNPNSLEQLPAYKGVRCYPNPTQGALMVMMEEPVGIQHVKAIALNGQQTTLPFEQQGNNTRIQMNGLSTGNYIIVLQTQQRIIQRMVSKF